VSRPRKTENQHRDNEMNVTREIPPKNAKPNKPQSHGYNPSHSEYHRLHFYNVYSTELADVIRLVGRYIRRHIGLRRLSSGGVDSCRAEASSFAIAISRQFLH
jgi:hypothetical protein